MAGPSRRPGDEVILPGRRSPSLAAERGSCWLCDGAAQRARLLDGACREGGSEEKRAADAARWLPLVEEHTRSSEHWAVVVDWSLVVVAGRDHEPSQASALCCCHSAASTLVVGGTSEARVSDGRCDGESAVADALRLLRLRDLAAGDSSGKRSRTRPSVVVLSGIAFVCVSVAASVLLDWLAPHRQIKFREGKNARALVQLDAADE